MAFAADIYFHQRNADEHQAALELRDAVLRLRRDGAFVAVPLFRVNTDPIGPHPVGTSHRREYLCTQVTYGRTRLIRDMVPLGVLRLGVLVSLHESRKFKVSLTITVWSSTAPYIFLHSILVHPLTREQVSACFPIELS